MVKNNWLNKYIKQQKPQRDIIKGFLGKHPGDVQRTAEIENWDRPKKRVKR